MKAKFKGLIEMLWPHIDPRYDFTYAPEYVKGRSDVCAVRRMAENGVSYGFDTIYLVWKDKKKEKFVTENWLIQNTAKITYTFTKL